MVFLGCGIKQKAAAIGRSYNGTVSYPDRMTLVAVNCMLQSLYVALELPAALS